MLNSWYKLQVPVYYVPISISFVLYPATTFILTFTGIYSYKFFTNRLNYNNDNNSDDEKDIDDTLDEKLETFSDEETSDQEPNHDNNINQKSSNNHEPIHYIDNNNSEILSGEESEESEYDGHTEIVLEKSDEIEKQISFESSNDSELDVHGYDRHCIIF